MSEPRALDAVMIRGIGIVALFAGLSSVVRLVQDAAIAWRFGTGPMVDAYYFVYSLANWPLGMALSVLTVLVVPIEAALRGGDAVAAWRFRAELLGAVALGAVVLLPLAWWGMYEIAGGPAGGLEPATAAWARIGAPTLVFMIPLGIVSALFSAWLVAAGRRVVTLVEALPPLVLALLVLVVPGSVLFWGTAVGFAVQLLTMALLLHQAKELPRPRLGLSADAWQAFSQGALLLLATQALVTLMPVVDALFAARLGEGVVAALGYAGRLVVGLQAVAALALRRAGLPLLAQLAARSPAAARAAALRWATVAAAVGAAVALIVALSADVLVALLFERGNFTAGDRAQVASLLRWGMLQMPPFFAGIVLVTALASSAARRTLALGSVIGVVVKVLTSVALVPVHGAVGLLLASALMITATSAAAWVGLRRHLPHAKH